MKIDLKNKHFLKLLDYSPEEIQYLVDFAIQLKQQKYSCKEKKRLERKNIALIFEKDSTRTHCAFEVACHDQGAHVTYLGPSGSQIGHKESIKDTARVLGRMYDAIEYRGFGQAKVEELAKYAGVPVWNGLTDEFHPTQVLADFQTMLEHSNKPLAHLAYCFLGDGRFNMANSLLVGGAKMGMDVRIVAPQEYQPNPKLIEECRKIAEETGAKVTITDNIAEGVKSADFIYTDVWVSMGESESVWEERINKLRPFRVNADVMKLTGKPETKFMHCLPATHNRETKMGEEIFQKYGLNGVEVSEDVFESEASIVFDESENRVHTIKAVMVATLGN